MIPLPRTQSHKVTKTHPHMVGFGLLLDLAYTYVHVFPLMAKRPNVRLLVGYVLMVLVDWYNSFLQKQMPAGSVQDSTDVWSFLHFVFALSKHVFDVLPQEKTCEDITPYGVITQFPKNGRLFTPKYRFITPLTLMMMSFICSCRNKL